MKWSHTRRVACAMGVLFPVVVAAQGGTYRVGETIHLAERVELRVSGADAGTYSNVGLRGVGRAFDLQFEKIAGGILVLEPSGDPQNSGVILVIGDARIPPRALTKDRPDGGAPEVVMIEGLAKARDTGRSAWFAFSTRPHVQFLFDVPRDIALKPGRLVLEVLIDGKRPPVQVEIGLKEGGE